MKILWFLAPLLTISAAKIAYAVSTAAVAAKTGGALFTRTSAAKIRAILEEVPMAPETRLYDLGCGDGRFLLAAWRRYGVRGVGYEINPYAYLLFQIRKIISRAPVTCHRQDFWKAHLGQAEVIFCYLFPDIMPRLATKLARELPEGARIISCNFPLPGWPPEKVIRIEDPIFFYQKRRFLCEQTG
ncbi:class I SAM-dependent methyltransferase [Thermosulfuriphilus ammonigenes]|uniref:Class I SAM-dependent methyltransferase n=1 Tax=Thermosulfuriphilus ammonigenes TaxID=1936021 RepID=A0A6G7PUY7_9BACT|nr:class I SAM-dependent methyltransferase [Thermosulfuriphilus ammonigenes]MBA2848618.1 SAM-dependent methyltransferase [Thermosulfuriphilus ammonigenes]QIJ71243.1 class I SAM-dependent methyltransferase [Thermosulfuriphilus ammonigenes]